MILFNRTVYENIYLNKENINNLSFMKDFNMEHFYMKILIIYHEENLKELIFYVY